MGDIISKLYDKILDRKDSLDDKSYTRYLFDKGLDKILKKVGEECTEVIISAKGDNKQEQIGEISDLTYHLLVMMAKLDISLEDIKEELEDRNKKMNNFKGDRKEIDNL